MHRRQFLLELRREEHLEPLALFLDRLLHPLSHRRLRLGRRRHRVRHLLRVHLLHLITLALQRRRRLALCLEQMLLRQQVRRLRVRELVLQLQDLRLVHLRGVGRRLRRLRRLRRRGGRRALHLGRGGVDGRLRRQKLAIELRELRSQRLCPVGRRPAPDGVAELEDLPTPRERRRELLTLGIE